MNTEQMAVWKGEFGADYTERNKFPDVESFNGYFRERFGHGRDDMNDMFVSALDRQSRFLEIGANVGNQLAALQRMGFSRLYGLEIQRVAIEASKSRWQGLDIVEGSGLDIPYKDNFADVVFTSDVLIHISPDDLGTVMDEIYRCSRSYIWGFEYFAPELTEINYRKNQNLLWKANYCQLFCDRFDDLEVVKIVDFPYLIDEEAGNIDQMYLLKKKSS
jgi:pseudaminic acid biosynthesis-associated methylase